MNKIKYSDDQIIAALQAEHGLISPATRRLGCNLSVIYRRLKKSAALQEVIDQERGVILDLAENCLFEAVSRGETKAAIFILSTLGRKRGYVTRQEFAGPDNQPVDIVINWGNGNQS